MARLACPYLLVGVCPCLVGLSAGSGRRGALLAGHRGVLHGGIFSVLMACGNWSSGFFRRTVFAWEALLRILPRRWDAGGKGSQSSQPASVGIIGPTTVVVVAAVVMVMRMGAACCARRARDVERVRCILVVSHVSHVGLRSGDDGNRVVALKMGIVRRVPGPGVSSEQVCSVRVIRIRPRDGF